MGRGLVKLRLRYLVEDVDRHGNVRLYVARKGRKKIRIHEVPGTEAFMRAYQAALAGVESEPPAALAQDGAAVPDTLAWLVRGYYASAAFKGLDRRTQRVRRGILDQVIEKHGHKRFRLMQRRHVIKLRDERAEKPEAANARVKALRQVFKWAMDALPNIEVNPAAAVPYLSSGSDGFHTWTVDEVVQFAERHPRGSKARLALCLLLFTGVRRSDAVRLGRQMERGDWLVFTEFKGRNRSAKHREIPILPELRAELDRIPAGQMTYLLTEFGKPYTAAGFGNWFRRRCNEAGLPHCSAHGLRKAGATIAAERGATEHQLMAIYGWESPKQAALYTRKANRKRLVGDAMHLVVPNQNENELLPLSSGLPGRSGSHFS